MFTFSQNIQDITDGYVLLLDTFQMFRIAILHVRTYKIILSVIKKIIESLYNFLQNTRPMFLYIRPFFLGPRIWVPPHRAEDILRAFCQGRAHVTRFKEESYNKIKHDSFVIIWILLICSTTMSMRP